MNYAAMRDELHQIKLANVVRKGKALRRLAGSSDTPVRQALREVVGKAPKTKPLDPKHVEYVKSIMG
jgi:hypothetical protein